MAEIVTDATEEWNTQLGDNSMTASSFSVNWNWSGSDVEQIDFNLINFTISPSIEFSSLESNDFTTSPDAVGEKMRFSALFDDLDFETTGTDELDEELLKLIILQKLLSAAQEVRLESGDTSYNIMFVVLSVSKISRSRRSKTASEYEATIECEQQSVPGEGPVATEVLENIVRNIPSVKSDLVIISKTVWTLLRPLGQNLTHVMISKSELYIIVKFRKAEMDFFSKSVSVLCIYRKNPEILRYFCISIILNNRTMLSKFLRNFTH